MSNNDSIVKSILQRRKGISLVWVVPIASLLIGIWLVWVGVISAGKTITIEFPNGDGIAAGQTELRFKGIKFGTVKSLAIKKDLSGVNAIIELDREVKNDIPEDSKFWLVEPQITAAGVSGLGTIFSGSYIEAQRGTSRKDSTRFVALSDAPPLALDTPGLHLKLSTDRLGSLKIGDPILYKQIQIGTVQSHKMSLDDQSIDVNMFIKPEYAHLIGKNTRFWNASGIEFNASLAGIKIRTESVATIIAGGIAVSDRDAKAPQAVNGDPFILFPDYETAEVGIKIKLALSSIEGISTQTKVIYRGLQVGRVLKVDVDREAKKFIATVGFRPQALPYLTDKTKFYLISPEISLAGITGIDALVNGSYLTVDVSTEGKPTLDFEISEGNLPVDYSLPGLHITLLSPSPAGLHIGSPLLFRNITVGTVENIALNEKGNQVEIGLNIQPQYAHLINENTSFWNNSGIDMNIGLGGLSIKSESIASLLAGGINFYTPQDAAKPAENRQQFILHKNEESARSKISASFELSSAEGLRAGLTKIIYQGLDIGIIEKIKLLPDGRGVIADARFIRDAESLLKIDSYFWMVKPELGLLKVSGLDAILSGPYITLAPGKGNSAKRFVIHQQAPAANFNLPGLHVTLKSKTAAGLNSGSPVLYKDITAGEITAVRPANDGSINIYARINPEFAQHISNQTRFWNANGLEIKAGAGGIKLRTESAAALLAGGVVFGNDDDSSLKTTSKISNPTTSQTTVRNGDTFQLFETHDAARNAGIQLTLIADSANALVIGTPILLHGVNVGQITALQIDLAKQGVNAAATIRNDLRQLINSGSKFHLRNVQIGLARTENLGAILNGAHIDFVSGEGQAQTHFPLLTQDPLTTRSATGLNLVLDATQMGSIKAGDPVTYRQFKVGNVLGTALSNDGQKVQIYINLWPGYEKLVRNNSRFWRSSGIKVEAGLFKGVEIKTESVETIIAGGIAFATPEDIEPEACDTQHFELANEAEDAWMKWSPAL